MRRGLALLLLMAPGCAGREVARPASIDLVARFDRADKRPPDAVFTVRDATFGGRTLSAIVAAVPSRIAWQVRIPRRAVLHTAFGVEPAAWKDLGGGVVFRVGISDRRTYETLLSQRLDALASQEDRAWRRASVDLSGYAGWQWSFFYRPSATLWQIVFSIDGFPAPGTDRAQAVWGAPVIDVAR